MGTPEGWRAPTTIERPKTPSQLAPPGDSVAGEPTTLSPGGKLSGQDKGAIRSHLGYTS